MKLKNKKTGEIGYPYFQNWKEITCVIVNENAIQIAEYTSLAELNDEWEDYEEPKDIFWIDNEGTVCGPGIDYSGTLFEKNKEIGNYFDTREEAEKAVEKLKAFKRLKDKGFRFDGYDVAHNSNGDLCGQLFYNAGDYCIEDVEPDLDLLFSGEGD